MQDQPVTDTGAAILRQTLLIARSYRNDPDSLGSPLLQL
jgi:hypothetical protein